MHIRAVRTLCFAQPMIPIHEKTFPGKLELVLTIVESDGGLEGYSLARAHGGQPASVIAHQVETTLRPLVLGRDSSAPELLWERMTAFEAAGYVSVFAISALDVAIWDLAGKLRGLPVVALCGDRCRAIKAYASSTHYEHIDHYVSDMQAALDQGFAAYKVHPFYEARRDIELARALREAAGPAARLMFDAAKRYNRSDALLVGQALQALDFHWYEEPLQQHDWAGYAQLRAALHIPVIGGETLPGLHHAIVNALNANAYAGVLCDVYWKGGITGFLKTIALCQSAGVPLASHHGASALMNLANLHVLCGATDVDMIEVLYPEAPYRYGLMGYASLSADGRIHVPEEAGLGGRPDWQYIETHRTT